MTSFYKEIMQNYLGVLTIKEGNPMEIHYLICGMLECCQEIYFR